LRDFNDKVDNFDRIKDMLDKDVQKIWSEIYKPPELAHSKPSDFFDFEYCMLSNKIFLEEKFYEGCMNLKHRFDVGAKNTLFPSLDSKNVPMDGLSVFIDKTWEKIKTQKELNLPDQRQMVANYRCNELKDEALEKVRPLIQSLREECERRLIHQFEQRCSIIYKQAITHYDEFAHQYDKETY
jgi:hypothetical protein